MNELKEIRAKALVGVRDIARDNKDKIEEAYEWIMRLYRIAQQEGLLALEYETGFIPKDMPLCKEICTMVRFVTDGTEPKFLAELMTLKFIGEGYQGLEALLYFLYARGMLLIQAGESLWMLEAIFSAVIPSDILSFDWQYSIWQDEKRQKVENIKKLLSEKEKCSLRNIAIQMAELTEAEWNKLVVAKRFCVFDKVIPYFDEDTQMLVKEHVNESRYYTIMQFPEIIKEDEIYQIEREFEAMIIAIRAKEEPTGLLSDMVKRSDEEIQELIKELDNSTMALALKGESKEVQESFLRNMTLRLKYEIQDDMEYMGPVRRCDVEDAQKKIRNVAEEKLGWQWKV